MHNCVGGYYNRVKNQESIIFFVREKDKPNESYITAEFKRGLYGNKLGQFYKSYNRYNDDKDAYTFGLQIAGALNRGIKAGRIT